MLTTKASAPFEFKELDKKGSFEGLVAVYGNIDSQDDVIEPGAFQKVKTTPDGKLKILTHHDTRNLVGTAVYKETEKGLHLTGQLLLDTPKGLEAYSQVKAGLLSELSVGFQVLPGGREFKELEDGRMIRHITKAELFEGSLVPFAANEEAVVTDVKGVESIETRREFERFLRKAGFSKRKAAAITNHGFTVSGGDHSEAARAMLEKAQAISKLLKIGA